MRSGKLWDALRRGWHLAQRLDPRLGLRRLRFQVLNAGLPSGEMALRPGVRIAVDPRARESFTWFCFRSREMVRELDRFLAESAGKTSFLDVGACHGIFSLAFTYSRPEATAMAVDPSPIAYEILAANTRLNPGARLIPVKAALGAAAGTVRMRYSWHHLEARPEADDEPGTLEVDLRTLDDLCAEHGFRPDLMKIDVEGYELAVLEGGRRLLAEARPTLFLEVHPSRLRELGSSARAPFDLLARAGYRFYSLAGRPRSLERLGRLERVSRLLCVAG